MSSSTYTSPTVEETQQQPSTAHPGHGGSVGPTIAVLAVLTILGVIAGMIGRLCSGRPIMGRGGQYDFEAWAERKCSSCIDGHVGPPPRPRTVRRPDEGGPAEAAEGEVKAEGEEEPPEEAVPQPQQQPPREQRASRGDHPES